jgi:hypothetical protein
LGVLQFVGFWTDAVAAFDSVGLGRDCVHLTAVLVVGFGVELDLVVGCVSWRGEEEVDIRVGTSRLDRGGAPSRGPAMQWLTEMVSVVCFWMSVFWCGWDVGLWVE